ncbi:MBL fold metallo-hydrolase [Rhizobium sp. BK251]|uniref:MBL fold metallo-hydrolase n=1 Tax=Rhizobium sp. BK251 TaxID=2512125 RepID=UPI00104E2460|nr:MBL fold metallo-hydrolase [Rhizobium sp. BK251]TCL68321.1 Cft2 family RNA processing exonuclease [Rhizobium sp. BK251]
MKIKAISGYGGKTPACFLVELSGRRFLLDLGEGPEPGVFPDLAGVGPIDAVLVSHSHKDHVGGLHLLGQVGSPPVYSTAMARTIYGGPAFDPSRDLPLHGSVDILGVTVETGLASHAPGGIWMRLGGEDGVLYTGDWTLESAIYRFDPPPQAAVLICDASYGNYEASLADSLPELATEAARGPLLLPMPPAGRGLDAAVILAEAGFEVSICRAHREVATRLIESKAGEVTEEAKQRLYDMLGEAGELTETSIASGVLIAATADAAGGIAQTLASRFSADRSAAIMFTGHLAKGTPGKELVEQDSARFIRWNVHPRASDFRWLVECVRPRAILPAFIGEPGLGEFIAANPGMHFVAGEVELG